MLIPVGRPYLTMHTGLCTTTSQISEGGGTTIDAAGEKATMLMIAENTGNISKIHVKLGTVGTGGPTSLEGRIETVDATGSSNTYIPSGTLWSANTNGTVSVASTDDNTWKTITLTSVAAVTRGNQYAVVFNNPGTQSIIIDGSVSGYAMAGWFNGSGGTSRGWVSSAWAAVGASLSVIVEYESGALDIAVQAWPWQDAASHSSSLAITAGQQGGNKIIVPWTGTIVGANMALVRSATRGDTQYKVYREADLTNPVASSAVIDKDSQGATALTVGDGRPFTASFDVRAGEVLYLVMEPSGANASVSRFQCKSGFLTSLRPWRTGEKLVTRAGTSGSFTESSNDEFVIGTLYYSHIDDGRGPGGASFSIGGLC